MFVDHFFRDVRYAIRGFVRSPGFSTMVIVTLALGIGANTAIFSLLDATLLRPLPYAEADRIVALSEANHAGTDVTVSWPDFTDWRRESRSFSAIAALRGANLNLTGSGQAERLRGLRVSAAFLSVLGIHPFLGRDFQQSDDRPGAAPVVMLSNALWARRFGGAANAIGRNIRLDDRSYEVAGVLPPDFRFVYARDVYIPIGLDADKEPNRGVRDIPRVLAKLKPGVSIAAASGELKTLTHRLEQAYPEYDSGVQATLRPFAELVAAPARQGLVTLSIGVGVLLLIACANVASLLLARAGSRQREMAIRIAVGAGRRRLMSQLFTESGLLALAGGAAGCVLAAAILPLLTALIPMDQGETEQYVHAALNLRVLLFTACLTLGATLLFGLAPAWRTPSTGRGLLGSGARTANDGFQRISLRNILVTGQIALAVVLLAGAGLLTQSLLRLLNTNMGFETDHLLTARLKLPSNRYPDSARRAAFFDSLMQRLDVIPGVAAASAATCLPFAGKDCWPSVFHIEGQPGLHPEDMLHAHFNAVEPGYLKAMQIPLIHGRDLDEHDDLQSPHVALVNQSFVRQFLRQTDPVGKRIEQGYSGDKNGYLIVGVVGDARRESPDVAPAPEALLPVGQIAPDAVELAIRTQVPDPMAVSPEIARAVRGIDPDVPVYDVRKMEWYIDYQTADRRFPTLLLSGFAGLALLLASVGLYGLISYLVAQRTKEFGIRIALGAQPGDVTRLVMKQGLLLVAAGLVIGLVGAWAMTRFIAALLFAIQPDDGPTFAAISCLLAAVACFACWLPARRAATVDPVNSLRVD
jgi:putative ABC transport system permease protein